jgi:hypothetical protein
MPVLMGEKQVLMGKSIQLGDFPASHVSLPKGKQMFQSMLGFWVKKLKIHVRLCGGSLNSTTLWRKFVVDLYPKISISWLQILD